MSADTPTVDPQANGAPAEPGHFLVETELMQVVLNVLAQLPYNTPTSATGRCTGDLVNILRALEPVEAEEAKA